MIDDYEKTAKDLWVDIVNINTTSSSQLVNKLIDRLTNLPLDENKVTWDQYVSMFMYTLDALVAFYEALIEK